MIIKFTLVSLFFIQASVSSAFPPKQVEIKAKDGIVVSATYFEAPKNAIHAAVLVHEPEETQERFQTLAQKLQKSGIHTVTFDARYHGGSVQEGKKDPIRFEAVTEDLKRSYWQRSERDLAAIIKWLPKRTKLNSRIKLFLMGARRAVTKLIYCARDTDFETGLVFLDPPSIDEEQAHFGFDFVRGNGGMLENSGEIAAPILLVVPSVRRKIGLELQQTIENSFEAELEIRKTDVPLIEDKGLSGLLQKWMKRVSS